MSNKGRDWMKCFLCQEDRPGKKLLCPAANPTLRNKPEELRSIYVTQIQHLMELSETGQMPKHISVADILDDGVDDGCVNIDSVVECMMSHPEMVWHKVPCRTSVDSRRVQDAKRKTEPEAASSPAKKHLRSSNIGCTAEDDGGNAECKGGISGDNVPVGPNPCFICEKVGEKTWSVRKATTFGVNGKVWSCALKTRKFKLAAKFSNGDMIAADAEYHLRCLSALYREAYAVESGTTNKNQAEREAKELAFLELVDFVESYRGTGTILPMSKMVMAYEKRLKSLGVVHIVHTSRLRQQLLDCIPDLTAIQANDRTWDIMFNEDLSHVINEVKKASSSEKMALYMKAANWLRDDFLQMRQNFKGSFTPSSEMESTSDSLKLFLSFLIDGNKTCYSDLEEGDNAGQTYSDTILSIAQIIQFNAVKRRSKNGNVIMRHMRDKETPWPLYVGIKLRLHSDKRVLDLMHSRGQSVSYDRIKTLSTDIANSVISHWNELGVVVPSQAVLGVFSTIGFDNVDWNAKATVAKPMSTLHGTLIALHQHFSEGHTMVVEQNINVLCKNQMGKKHIQPLPASYTDMDSELKFDAKEVFKVPTLDCESSLKPTSRPTMELLTEQHEWLEATLPLLEKDQLNDTDNISWFVYN